MSCAFLMEMMYVCKCIERYIVKVEGEEGELPVSYHCLSLFVENKPYRWNIDEYIARFNKVSTSQLVWKGGMERLGIHSGGGAPVCATLVFCVYGALCKLLLVSFLQLSFWISSEICSLKDAKTRGILIEKFIEVAKVRLPSH